MKGRAPLRAGLGALEDNHEPGVHCWNCPPKPQLCGPELACVFTVAGERKEALVNTAELQHVLGVQNVEWVSHGVQGPWGPEPFGAASLQAGWWVALGTLTGLQSSADTPATALRPGGQERSLVGREAEI